MKIKSEAGKITIIAISLVVIFTVLNNITPYKVTISTANAGATSSNSFATSGAITISILKFDDILDRNRYETISSNTYSFNFNKSAYSKPKETYTNYRSTEPIQVKSIYTSGVGQNGFR